MVQHEQDDSGGSSGPIGFAQARERMEKCLESLSSEEVPLEFSLSRILASEVVARVSSPTEDVSLKDGFAVIAHDTLRAAGSEPAILGKAGSRYAGGEGAFQLLPGSAVKVTSGAVLPQGADAVVGCEYCTETAEQIQIEAPVCSGKNVLKGGEDIREGALLGRAGEVLAPGRIGWMAAAGVERVQVIRSPHVALVATGDEVVAPGRPLRPGQLYASNLCTLAAWLRAFGMSSSFQVLPDQKEILTQGLLRALEGADALITSGGAWGSERDLVVKVLDELGWHKIFHRVRLGPGKAVGFGLWKGTPVFCLPGGPPSNEMAFLQLALPGLLRLAGRPGPPFPCREARLTEQLSGRGIDWTQIVRGSLKQDQAGIMWVAPYRAKSRLESMAMAECLILIPEGTERLEKNQLVEVQLLSTPAGSSS